MHRTFVATVLEEGKLSLEPQKMISRESVRLPLQECVLVQARWIMVI